MPLSLLHPWICHHSNSSSPNVFVLYSCDIVVFKAGAKSCTQQGTSVMEQSRGQALETHLGKQSCFQPCQPFRTANLALDGISASRHKFFIPPGLFWKEVLFTRWEESTENSYRSLWMDCEPNKAAMLSRDSSCW